MDDPGVPEIRIDAVEAAYAEVAEAINKSALTNEERWVLSELVRHQMDLRQHNAAKEIGCAPAVVREATHDWIRHAWHQKKHGQRTGRQGGSHGEA